MKTLLALSLLSASLSAQTLKPTTGAVQPNGTVLTTVNWNAGPATAAAVQYTLTITPSVGITVTSSTSLIPGKSIETGPTASLLIGLDTSVSPNTLNSTVLTSNNIASHVITIGPNAAPGTYTVSLTGLVAADPSGSSIAVTSGGTATFTVTPSPFDVDGNGSIDAADVSAARKQADGLAPCTTGDVNHDTHCDVLDVQQVIHATGH